MEHLRTNEEEQNKKNKKKKEVGKMPRETLL